MNTRLATIALTAFFLLAQTVTAQITVPDRFVQIRSVNLTTSVLELFNSGTSSQSLAGWRFCTHDEDSVRRYSSATGLNNVTLASGDSLFVHFNNDADPADAQAINVSTIGGAFAQPLDADGAYGAQIYFQTPFGVGANIADHLQFSLDGLDDQTADERSDEAQGEVWVDQNDWISVSLDTEMIVLDAATSDSEIHSSSDYTVVDPVAVVLGDLDGDGMVTFADIPLFINALISGDFVAAADTDESGVVDFADIPAFITLLQGG